MPFPGKPRTFWVIPQHPEFKEPLVVVTDDGPSGDQVIPMITFIPTVHGMDRDAISRCGAISIEDFARLRREGYVERLGTVAIDDGDESVLLDP